MTRVLPFLLLPLLFCSACSLFGNGGGPDFRYFVVRVDSVSVSASVRVSDTLTVGLFGTLGPSSCYSLERIKAKREPSRIELQVIGKVDVNAAACLTVMVPLRATYKATPPLEGPFEVIVRQPDDATLERIVAVVE